MHSIKAICKETGDEIAVEIKLEGSPIYLGLILASIFTENPELVLTMHQAMQWLEENPRRPLKAPGSEACQ